MKIIVEEMPKRSGNCLFRKYFNEKFGHWTCGFSEKTVCSLDMKGKCSYLCELKEYEEDTKNANPAN